MFERYRRFIIAIALGIVAFGAFFYLRNVKPLEVETASVERNVEVRVFGVGAVEAQTLSKIGFQVSGRIVSITADQGDIVEAGAVLATLEESSQKARVAKAQVGKLQAETALEKARAVFKRAEVNLQQKSSVNQRRQTLVDRGSVSREAADDAQTNEAISRSDLEIAKADVQVADAARRDVAATQAIEQVALDQHRLLAPFRARVLTRLKEVGGIAGVGEPVFSVIDPGSIWVRAFIDEALAGGIRVGQTAFVRLRSEPLQSVEAEVVRIDQENDRVTEERRLYVRCRACQPDHQVRFLGEQAEVEIVKRVVPEGTFVPLRSVEAFDGKSGSIWTLVDGKLNKRRVTLGDRLLDGRILILDGLPSGARAVVSDHAEDFKVGRVARSASDNAR